MLARSGSKWFVVAVLVAAALAVSPPGRASNLDLRGGPNRVPVATGSDEKRQTEGYGSPLLIPAADFRGDGIDPTSAVFWFNEGLMRGRFFGAGCLMAPAYLPDGVTVTSVFATVVDGSATWDREVSLHRVRTSDGTHLARTIHQISTAADDAPHSAALSHLGVLGVLSSTPPRLSARNPHCVRRLAGLVTNRGE